MKLSLTTWLHLRSALLMALKAIDAALLEGYGWTPRGGRSEQVDDRVILSER